MELLTTRIAGSCFRKGDALALDRAVTILRTSEAAFQQASDLRGSAPVQGVEKVSFGRGKQVRKPKQRTTQSKDTAKSANEASKGGLLVLWLAETQPSKIMSSP